MAGRYQCSEGARTTQTPESISQSRRRAFTMGGMAPSPRSVSPKPTDFGPRRPQAEWLDWRRALGVRFGGFLGHRALKRRARDYKLP
jgi:hypothetical protein